MSYGGTWELAGDRVTHHVAFALFPNWVGTDLIRDVSWEVDQLVLTGAPELTRTGKSWVHRLFWTRAHPNP